MKNKLGIVLALIFVMSFGSLVFAQNANSGSSPSMTTSTRNSSGRSRRRHRRKPKHRRGRRRGRRSGNSNGNMSTGNGNTRQ